MATKKPAPPLKDANQQNSSGSIARMYYEPPKPPTQAEMEAAVMPIIGHEDMTKMEDMNEETLLNNVKLRYENDLIYVSEGEREREGEKEEKTTKVSNGSSFPPPIDLH